MNHKFSQIPKAEIPRSSFDRSHGHKTTIDSGLLYPIFLDEALPGDTFNLKMHAVARMATPIFPVMDNIYIDTFFFAVPMRLLWDNWEKFNGQQTNPGDSTDFTIPTIAAGGNVVAGTIGDYFGLPIAILPAGVSAMPFRAYNLIWNEWFRDQNLQNSLPVYTTDSSFGLSEYTLQRRGKRHDYFTSCLPWPQKGEAVDIPLGSTAPIVGTGQTFNLGDGTVNLGLVRTGADGKLGTNVSAYNTAAGTANAAAVTGTGVTVGTALNVPTGLVADLSAATAATINTLRQAFQVQKILERDARGGTRYTEIIKAHFGVTSPDARLQRPEYLGGYSQPINIREVQQNSQAPVPADSPLGTLAAIGTAHIRGGGNGFTQSFTEHCIIIGLISIRAELTYQQKLERMWSRKTRFDFFWPALSHIGEQAVLNKELYFSGTPATDDAAFGYQERYAEYRYKPSQVTGLFRSNNPTSLDSWHLALDYAATPLLNATFIEENPPIARVVAVQTEPQFILDCWFDLNCARPMPMYGVPGMIDHF